MNANAIGFKPSVRRGPALVLEGYPLIFEHFEPGQVPEEVLHVVWTSASRLAERLNHIDSRPKNYSIQSIFTDFADVYGKGFPWWCSSLENNFASRNALPKELRVEINIPMDWASNVIQIVKFRALVGSM